jgi:eukaryotic-like serine/threonine-protein kinase
VSLISGHRLGPYQVVAAIGAGGMGEVYRARDSKLNRDVALKILPANLAGDAQYMARFQREAQVLASLNHPHVASIYGLEESSGVRALVMELVEGPTLADRIKKRPIPVKEALEIARQIAEALEYAHEKGVIHRDLKPTNVKITPEGTVKVLDFGLAKAAEQLAESKEWENAPTVPASMSRPGLILGTPAYMAPEQARGEAVDDRGDIWAFGVVLWEVLCGRCLFGGATTSDTLANVLRSEVDLESLPADTPTSIRRLLKRCLERDRKNRLQAIGDARLEIDECLADPTSEAAPGKRPLLPWVAAAAFAGATLAISLLHFRQIPPESHLTRYSIAAPEKTEFAQVAPSPDGRMIALTAQDSAGKSQLWVRRLDSFNAQPLAGTAGAVLPFWSPNSRSIGFWADGKLKKIDVGTTSAPQTLCDAPDAGGATWSGGGVIIFGAGPHGALFRTDAAGGEAKPLTSLDQSRHEKFHLWPWFLPDGRHLLYTVVSEKEENSGVYMGSLDSPDRKRLVGDLSNAAYVKAPENGGYLLFVRKDTHPKLALKDPTVREGTLMAQSFDATKLQLTGAPRPVAEQVNYDAESGGGCYSVSDSGLLVFLGRGFAEELTQLTWFDRSGTPLGTVGEPAIHGWRTQLSPNEKKVAVERKDPNTGTSDVWIIDLARGISSRFAFDPPANDLNPVWSSDGKRITFASNQKGVLDLYEKDVEGVGKERLLFRSNWDKWPNDWSQDGRFLLYVEPTQKTSMDLWVLPSNGKPVAFQKTAASEFGSAFSPDGKWVAFMSNESGQFEIYVRAFHLNDEASGSERSSTEKWRVSSGGGIWPRWRGDGSELFYETQQGQITAVEIRTTPTFRAGPPVSLFETRSGNDSFKTFAVTANGQRFLIPTPIGNGNSTSAAVVMNWTQGLKQ